MSAVAWAKPTWRAMRWRPLVLVGAVVLAMVLVFGAADAAPVREPLVFFPVVLLIAAGALALDDPAHALVAATPVGFSRRLLHRLAWVVALVGLVAAGIDWLATRLDVVSASARVVGCGVALSSVTLVTHVLVARRRPDVAAHAAAVTPAVWVVILATTSPDGPLAPMLWAPIDRPWAVAGVALASAAALARRM